ncbi:hypothetical protein [Litchfieldella rifensis]|uniref:Uncharacterized protein n=1 Tax=Litchfieldella rifensis TaxID=762643 RepID=A0ABV7LKE9_9GAMM
MSSKPGPSIYIPSDKNIFDALQHKKIRHSEVQRFLRNRGIIVSSDLEKIDLSKFIARLTFDYGDYVHITKLLENPNRKEKTTRTTVKATSNNEQLVEACQKITKSTGGDESYKVVKKEDSTILVVTYTETDFTKTELRQKTLKKCEIELHADGDEVTVRMPATKKGKELSERIKSSLSNILGEELEEEVISLESIAMPEARSLFFDELIKSIPGYELEDVSSVDVYHEIDNLDDEQDDSDEDNESSTNFAGFIRKAALAGGGVLESAEFNQLHSRGFFISKIIWTVVDTLPGGDKVELEAQFGQPSSCSDFKYLVRGVYNYNDRAKIHNTTKRTPSRVETGTFNKKLEKAAKIAFDKVASIYVGAENEDD